MTVTSSSLSSASPYATASTTTALTVLASVAASTVQETNTKILASVNQDMQNQLNIKLAALQQTPDAAVTNAIQAQINALNTQQTALTTLTASAVTNAGLLSDLQDQLATLQTDAAAGNSAGFDNTLTAANTDLSDLTPSIPPAPFQPDQVSSLLGTGLGITNSSSYDLSTPAGQAAAEAAVSSAQTTVGQVFSLTTSNEFLASSMSTALTTQLSNLTNQLQQLDAADQAQITAQTNSLTQQATDREHLVELNLGSSSNIAKMVEAATNPPQPYTSVFQALEAAVGSNGTQTTAPAILSLLT